MCYWNAFLYSFVSFVLVGSPAPTLSMRLCVSAHCTGKNALNI